MMKGPCAGARQTLGSSGPVARVGGSRGPRSCRAHLGTAHTWFLGSAWWECSLRMEFSLVSVSSSSLGENPGQ